jgi:uncharacterized protein (TIGR03437 family)
MRYAFLVAVAAAWPVFGQSVAWDSSGNSMLNGTYYFREVFYIVGDNAGDLGRAIALYGNVSFDGAGHYTMTSATVVDSNASVLQTLNHTGTYTIAASGYGYLSNPLSSTDNVFGLVGQKGIFVGSSTEAGSTTGFNDLFIAAPVSSPAATNATFKGTYWVADTDAVGIAQGSPSGVTSSLFQLSPDGAGNLGNVAITGFVGAYGSSLLSQSFSGVKYVFSNGAANLQFPNSNSSTPLISGQRYMYITPDGDFVFGGSPVAWDFFVGVRTSSTAPTFSGQYYQAGIDEDDSQLGSGYGLLDTYYGSLAANSGLVVGHQRIASVFNSGAIDYTYGDAYNVSSNGTYTAGALRYAVGAGGLIRIGSGIGPYLGLNVAVAAPSLTGSGVYLDPAGIVNAASSAPFTTQIAPGELITLYGSNLASSPLVASTVPYPTTLGKVQVMINGTAAPIYYVAPTVVSVWVPYSITGSVAQIQVINNGSSSNSTTMWIGTTAPGIFTNPANGLGYAAALHSDYSLVTPSHPAVAGETISVYLTGLGAVTPSVADGALAPMDTLSKTNNAITADIAGVTATVGFAGLAPGLAGLYQVNLTIPSGLSAGDHILDIAGPTAYTTEALISISGSTAAAGAEAVRPAGKIRRKPPQK